MRIERLKLYEHKMFIDTEVIVSNSEQKGNLKTVVIGPNGAGKSSFLSLIHI